MAIRSKYTNPSRPPRPASEHRRSAKVPAAPNASAVTKAKNALKNFAKYVEKNQRDSKKDTGDRSSLSNDLASIPMRVIRETGKLGHEESERIKRLNRRDSDEEIVRFMSGRSKPKPQQQCCSPQPRQHLEFEIKPKPKKKPPARKVIYLEYDPEAEVG